MCIYINIDMPTEIIITRSNKPDKKYDATIDGKKTVSFGQKGASDFTKHNNNDRKQSYIARHKKNEHWGIGGLETAGFYSKHINWNKSTVKSSVNDTNKRFKDINFKIK